MKRTLLLLAAAAGLWSACGDAPAGLSELQPAFVSPSMTPDSLRALLSDAYDAGTFNGAVVICRDGDIAFEEYYGVESASGDTLTRTSAFRLASLSKAYTAAGILRLCEQGKLDLDGPVQAVMSDFPYADVTPRHLLNHTSGIGDLYLELATVYEDSLGPVLTIDEVVGLVNADLMPKRAAGDTMVYSNTGYVFAAGLIQHVSGQSFEDFMRTELFEPMGMTNTRVWNLVSADSTFEGKTTGFEWIQGQRVPVEPMWMDGVAGDGAVFSCGADLVKWERFWWQGNPAINDELLKAAFANVTTTAGDTTGYGFGWDLGEGVQFHTGGWLSAATYILRIPSERVMAVAYSNAGEDAMKDIILAIDQALGVEE